MKLVVLLATSAAVHGQLSNVLKGSAEVTTEVGTTEVGTTEVGTTEVGTTESPTTDKTVILDELAKTKNYLDNVTSNEETTLYTTMSAVSISISTTTTSASTSTTAASTSASTTTSTPTTPATFTTTTTAKETSNISVVEGINPENDSIEAKIRNNSLIDDLLYIEDLPLEIIKNETLLESLTNSTHHRGILHGFTESISVILVSEIGDKTFFIAAILAMRNNKLTVFLAALSALFLMTILSGLLGWVVTTFIPREITYYTCTAIMFAFALKMIWEAWRMEDDEMEEVQKEVEQELAELEGPGQDSEAGEGANRGQENPGFEGPAVVRKEEGKNVAAEQGWVNNAIDRGCKENSWFGKKCLKIFKLFVNTFTLTFIAEWGDRSQLATIVLAGINNVVGVILGGCLGHAICTGGAVLAGALIARFISIRKITFLGALVFLGFAIASIFIDPNEDGIDGIPDIMGYDNTTRLLNHNISLTIELEEVEGDFF